jgi:hypothetical protein
MSGSCGNRAACACVYMRHWCASTACRVRYVVELHGVCCDPSGAVSASCTLVRVVGAAEACGSSSRVGQREFMLKERCLGYKNTLYSSLYKRSREIHKTACVRYCVWAQLLSQLLFIFFFLCLLCEVERPNASQSRRSIPARADGRARADDRSQQEPMVDPKATVDPNTSLTRTLWPSSTASSSAISRNGNKSPSPAVASSPSATLADHLAKDGRSLCWHHRSFAKDDADARKIGKSSGKPDRRHAHPGPHRAVRLRGLAFRVGVQRRVHPEDVQAPLAAAPAHELLPPARLQQHAVGALAGAPQRVADDGRGA